MLGTAGATGATGAITAALVVVAALTAAAVPLQPEQIHLVMGGRPDEYAVQWVTAPGPAISITQFGPTPDQLERETRAVPVLFTESRCQSQRLMHSTVMRNISADRAWYYRVGSDAGPWSAIFRFWPVSADVAQPLVVSVLGDMGSQANATCIAQLAAATERHAHDLIVHYGDIAYNLDDECGRVGDTFMRNAQPYAASTPTVFGVGNHETDVNFTYVSYNMRYAGQLPLALASGSDTIHYFSFDTKYTHWVVVDTDVFVYPERFLHAPGMVRWLEADLRRTNRTQTPWLIVFGHRAMYCTKNGDAECTLEADLIRLGMEHLLVRYGVDLYVAGHTHHTQATFPVKHGAVSQRNFVDPHAPTHVLNGIGGVDGHDPLGLKLSWEAYRDAQFRVSYSRITIHNGTTLDFEIRDHRGQPMYAFTLLQRHHGPFSTT